MGVPSRTRPILFSIEIRFTFDSRPSRVNTIQIAEQNLGTARSNLLAVEVLAR